MYLSVANKMTFISYSLSIPLFWASITKPEDTNGPKIKRVKIKDFILLINIILNQKQ